MAGSSSAHVLSDSSMHALLVFYIYEDVALVVYSVSSDTYKGVTASTNFIKCKRQRSDLT